MNPFQKAILSLFMILLIIITSISACESKQKRLSEYENSSRSLEILAELDKWVKIESSAFDRRDYCTALQACQNGLELWKEYQPICSESQKVTVKEQIREAEKRLRTVKALCR